MLLHGNARLTPFQRTLLCVRVREEGWTVAEAAEAAGCSQRCGYRWLARHDAGDAMTDRSGDRRTARRSAARALPSHHQRSARAAASPYPIRSRPSTNCTGILPEGVSHATSFA